MSFECMCRSMHPSKSTIEPQDKQLYAIRVFTPLFYEVWRKVCMRGNAGNASGPIGHGGSGDVETRGSGWATGGQLAGIIRPLQGRKMFFENRFLQRCDSFGVGKCEWRNQPRRGDISQGRGGAPTGRSPDPNIRHNLEALKGRDHLRSRADSDLRRPKLTGVTSGYLR
jgi:hypothetical protein